MLRREMTASQRARAAWLLAIAWAWSCGPSGAAAQGVEQAEEGAGQELRIRWQWLQTIRLPSDSDAELADVILLPEVFANARYDLNDLRIYDRQDRVTPYALRELRERQERRPFPAEPFNRVVTQGNVVRQTLDLGRDDVEHNQVEVNTAGVNFRRKVEVEGSGDEKQWGLLAEGNVIRFQRGEGALADNAVAYSPSRFRYLRISVYPDPLIDNSAADITEIQVVRKVDIPGELLTLPGVLGAREPVRIDGQPGSAWVVDLGGDRVPCDRLEVQFSDAKFARNFRIESAGLPDDQSRFLRAELTCDDLWQRREGDPPRPMTATFREVRAARLRLLVMDARNPPLNPQSVAFSAPARQLVFPRPQESNAPLRLFFGNPDAAEAPNYDFAGNLPDRLAPPLRGTLEALQQNPDFQPPPKPLTERWPWVIYVVLSAAGLVLAAIIANLSRTAIGRYEQQAASGEGNACGA